MLAPRLVYYFLGLFSFLMVSCGDKRVEAIENEIDYFQFHRINLTKFDLNASIYLPDASAGIGTALKPEIIHEEGGYKWQLSVGRYFRIYIEDYGNQRFLFEEKFDEIKNNKVYRTQIKMRDGSIVIYTKQLKSKLNNDNIETYYIYAVVKIKGYYYQITNRVEGNSKKEVEFMYKSIKSIKEI